MAWYAAHILVCTKFKDAKQDSYPVYENIVLIEADSDKHAFEKALIRGNEYEGDSSGTYYYEDKPAIETFVGIRKIIKCINPDERPGDGTEVSYSRMIVDSEEALKKLVEGEEVIITYEE